MRRALRVCSRQGCPNLTPGRYCPSCQPVIDRADRGRRGSATERGYTSARWRKLRAVVLARDPICGHCHQAPSTIADHIIPVPPGRDPADYDCKELQGLCESCHNRKTAEEQALTR